MKTAIYTHLTDDTTLMAILTGGLHQTVEINRQQTPAAFDANKEIQPCALLKLTTETPTGPYHHSSQLFFNLYFYERAGYTNIEAARARAYALLHRQRVTPTTGSNWEIHHSDDVLDEEDQALRCSMAMSRYTAYVMREGS